MKTNTHILVAVLTAGTCSLATRALAAEVGPEAQKLLGIEVADLTAKSLPPEVAVFGSVLSPAPMIELFRQLEAAQAALEVSKESLDRAGKLFASGELVARKEVQAAQAQHAQDQAKLVGLNDRLVLEWGPRFSKLAPADRAKLLDDLLTGHQALIRLAVSRGEPLATSPLAARLHSFGNEQTPIRCKVIFPAPAIDPAFQAKTFLGLLETFATPLAVGLTLTGALELAGEPRTGIFVPQNAVVFYLGKAWIYRKSGGDKFERLEIPATTAVDGGWFVAGDAVDPHRIVTKGVQSLLSQETLGTVEEE